jgi:hypothetical protein
LNISGQDTKVNLNVLPLGSYDILIGMDWLEKHKVVLNCYEKSFVYKDESGISVITPRNHSLTVEGCKLGNLNRSIMWRKKDQIG